MVAFICPIYNMKNHFDYGKQLLQSKIKCRIGGDICFIFSDIEQKDQFVSLVGDDARKMKWLILPETYKKYQAQANTKKLWGLYTLKDSYEYLVIVDVETLFLKGFDPEAVCKEVWDSRNILVANQSYRGFFLMRQCYQTMGIYENLRLLWETRWYRYYFWFNELQVYRAKELDDFFLWLQRFPLDKILNEWACFEHFLFAAFLITEKGWSLKRKKLKAYFGANEEMMLHPPVEQHRILEVLGSHWTGCRNAVNEKTVMAFHLDRQGNRIDDAQAFAKEKERCIRERRATIKQDGKTLLKHILHIG